MKKWLSLLLAVVLLLGLAACAAPQGAPEESSAPASPAFPVTVTDHAGRTVTVEKRPERLVSGYYISTSLLIALDVDQKLVGIEAKAGKRAIYKRSAPSLIDLPSVGTAKEFDMEGCLALQPDLVILPIKLKSAAETLEGMGIDVLLVNPESRVQLAEMIGFVSKATGTEQRAAQLTAHIDRLSEVIAERVAAAEKPRVYIASNSSLLSTAGAQMHQSDLVTLAGGVNVAADITDTYWADISYEQLLAWNPDYIILASDASYTSEEVLADPNLADCAAVKSGRVYSLPNKAEAWDSPVPGSVLGALWLASLMHSNSFGLTEFITETDAFYETFYGFTYSQN